MVLVGVPLQLLLHASDVQVANIDALASVDHSLWRAPGVNSWLCLWGSEQVLHLQALQLERILELASINGLDGVCL